jgi:site-specific recombinase XerC
LAKGLSAKTINCHLDSIRRFYDWLDDEDLREIPNPVKRGYVLRLPRLLPRHLKDHEVQRLFEVIQDPRDRAIFMVMLRCGLRVAEVTDLTLGDLDLRRSKILVQNGKGRKGRVVYLSQDAQEALVAYLKVRPSTKIRKVFLAMSHVTNSGTPWPPSCSMPMQSLSPSRIFWDTARSPPPSNTAGSQTSRFRETTSGPYDETNTKGLTSVKI